ncbi:MAG TPA: 2-oxoacid:acceptor oxidoreductase subunit alpha [Rectinemataceae bacterium]|nr:2-oxoacid:acceptor oxidoreductase subunit alpha [Rectinemataceae bacterium]
MSIVTKPGVNDFSIGIATRNGSGSQTANQVILRSLFAMGIPVGGKNIFPSNISGMPTWFYIRASAAGHVGRSERTDLMVCLNMETAADDLGQLGPGAVALIDEGMRGLATRSDIRYVIAPFARLAEEACPDKKLQKLVQNMIYVGILCRLLGIELEEAKAALGRMMGKKSSAIALNAGAMDLGHRWALSNTERLDDFGAERASATKGKILVEGNTAVGLGALFAGVTVAAWYPITPSTSVIEDLTHYAKRYRRNPADGKLDIAIIQMEDEISSAGVVVGASWAGARSMTATSGPGIDLMSETIGLAYWTETPGVFVDVQRTGPSTGLPTHTGQGDVELCAKASHGDTRHICLYPATMQECFDFTYAAFDLAERYQTPVFVLTDLDLGMQTWMSDPFVYPEGRLDRGKVLDEKALADISNWGRYRDLDGDGIPWRTLPGTKGGKGAFFTRGSARNDAALYSEKAADYVGQIERIARKIESAKERLPGPLEVADPKSGKGGRGIIAYGSSDPAVREALGLLSTDGRRFDYLRVRAFPFSKSVEDFIASHSDVFIVEQNRDGQLANLLADDFPALAPRLRKVCYPDTLPLPAEAVVEGIERAVRDAARGQARVAG